MDGTYNVDAFVSFMVEDECIHGVYISMLQLQKYWHEWYLSAIVKAFKECNRIYPKAKVIAIDKDITCRVWCS